MYATIHDTLPCPVPFLPPRITGTLAEANTPCMHVNAVGGQERGPWAALDVLDHEYM
jgi:hypothetical protein